MKVKVFHIRLTKENLETDQDNLNSFIASVTVKKTAAELISAQPSFWSILVFYDDHRITSEKITITSDADLTGEEKDIYESLRQWRQDKATELNLPTYLVAHNAELMTIAKIKPQTLGEFSKVKGFGEQKTAKYGDDIIALLNSI